MKSKDDFQPSEITSTENLTQFFFSLETSSDAIGNVSWWSDGNTIIWLYTLANKVKIVSSGQAKKSLETCYITFNIFFTSLLSCFCLKALESSCWNWIIYTFSSTFSFTIVHWDLSETSTSSSFLVIFPSAFSWLRQWTLVRTDRFLLEIEVGEAICSAWNFFPHTENSFSSNIQLFNNLRIFGRNNFQCGKFIVFCLNPYI